MLTDEQKQSIARVYGCCERDVTASMAIAIALIEKAIEGNTKAFEVIRDTIGQTVKTSIEIEKPNQDVLEEVRRLMDESSY